MILQHLVKKKFSSKSWTGGTLAFRDGRVADVSFHKPWVSGTVLHKKNSPESPAEVTFKLHRDGIEQCSCSCKEADQKCEHLAALVIWWLARGSLLRAGIQDDTVGASQNKPKPAMLLEKEAQNSIDAAAVTYVHLIHRDDGTMGICVEPAIKYADPVSKKKKVELIRILRKTNNPHNYKSIRGYNLKLDSLSLPILESLESDRITHLGTQAVSQLGKILKEDFKNIVFDPSLEAKLDPAPLKLKLFELGERRDDKRNVRFTLANDHFTISSEELVKLAEEGRVSSDFIWKDSTLYELAVPLSHLAKHIHKSGQNILEASGGKPLQNLVEIADDRENPLHPIAVFRLSLELGASEFLVDPSWTEYHEWKKDFDQSKIPSLPTTEFGYDLREYQSNGLSWLWSLYHRRLAAFLADDMGLGKTHQVLALLSSLYNNKKFKPKHPSIVVAPTSVVAAWKQKLQRYDTGLKWFIYHGAGRSLPEKEVDLVITTYGILQRDQVLRETDWHMAIADESQAIKNAGTSTSRISRTLKSQFRIAMTGTPVENSSHDLWSVMEFLLPGYLGSQARFKRLYGSKGDSLASDKTQTIKKLVSPFLLRRTKSQVLKELPEKTEETLLCEMTPYQKDIYNSFLQGQEAKTVRDNILSGGRLDYTGILALITKLKQVCDHPQLPLLTANIPLEEGEKLEPELTGKWDALSQTILSAIGSNLKVVVFTQFLGMLDITSEWLTSQGIGFTELRGDTRNRDVVLTQFNDDPNCKVFLCSLMAGGLGIDLTAASVCIHYDRWWNPARENQATDRLHRIGQTRGVQVFKLQCPGTVEDRIAKIIDRKIKLSGALIEDSSLGLKSFSRDELLSLLSELVGT